MTTVLAPFRWLFSPQLNPSAGRSIAWWEVRRIPVNLLIAAYGTVCLLVFLWGLITSGRLQPGDDAIEPIALLFVPVAFNLCYTLGWLVEVPARALDRNLSPRFGPLLMALGLGFSLSVISLPAVFWGGYRCLQLVGLVR